MKHRTDMVIIAGTRSGYPVLRSVYIEDGHYYIQWKKKTINVDEDIAKGDYHHKSVFR